MRKTRRILSIILTIALMMTMVQPNIFATDTSETSAVRGKINMVYLGTTPYSKPTDLQHADTLSPQNYRIQVHGLLMQLMVQYSG